MEKKTTKKSERDPDREDRINRALSKLRHKDLQRECILRGLEFQNIVDFDHHELSNWFYHNFEKPEELDRLSEYDAWIEQQLQDRGHKKGDAILSPSFRFGFSPDLEKIDGEVTTAFKTSVVLNAVDKIEKEVKIKREVDQETGIKSGTKKNLTYQLQKKGVSIEETIKQVLEAFPEAQEKSIKIWYKRSLNEE